MEKQKESLVTLRFAIIIETFKEERKKKQVHSQKSGSPTNNYYIWHEWKWLFFAVLNDRYLTFFLVPQISKVFYSGVNVVWQQLIKPPIMLCHIIVHFWFIYQLHCAVCPDVDYVSTTSCTRVQISSRHLSNETPTAQVEVCAGVRGQCGKTSGEDMVWCV